jgi:hypothetical protein
MTVRELKSAISELPDDMEVVIERDWDCGCNGPCTGVDTNHVRISDDAYDYDAVDVVNHDDTFWGIKKEDWEYIIRKPKVLLLRTKQVNPFE